MVFSYGPDTRLHWGTTDLTDTIAGIELGTADTDGITAEPEPAAPPPFDSATLNLRLNNTSGRFIPLNIPPPRYRVYINGRYHGTYRFMPWRLLSTPARLRRMHTAYSRRLRARRRRR